MEQKTILYQKGEALAEIILNRPERKNAIDRDMVEELAAVCREINGDEDIRVVIIRGQGEEAFSVGAEPGLLTAGEGVSEQIGRLSAAARVDAIDRPTIAALNGDAIGQGLELALSCDLRICVDSAHFAMPQITWGEIPRDGGTQRLSRVVGRGKALEMILLGETIGAQEAYRIGLVGQVVGRDDLTPAITQMAEAIAKKGPIALRYAKEAVGRGMDLTLAQGLRLEADLYCLLHATRDREEGIRSYQEKRSPRFEGR
jgi:enoyl-CoA hydratase